MIVVSLQRWKILEEKRLQEESELQIFLSELLIQHKNK